MAVTFKAGGSQRFTLGTRRQPLRGRPVIATWSAAPTRETGRSEPRKNRQLTLNFYAPPVVEGKIVENSVMMGRFSVTWVAVGALGVMATTPVHAAGFFDDFARAFLGRRTPPPVAFESFDPLSVTVKPKRQRSPETSSKPAPPVVKLDPSTDPTWYLRDPTLRRGDIVVTDTGVLVYQGRDSDALRPADFAMFGGGKDGAKGWRQQLQAAAAGGRSFFRLHPPAPAKIVLTQGDMPDVAR